MAKYNEKELADTSKFLSFVLRHKPEAIGIVLDREGWADIDKLILCAQKAGKRLTRALLDTVVATSDKKRFSYSSDGTCIRAVQGHSTSQVAIAFTVKKDYGEKKGQIPFNAHFFCRQLPGYSIPLLCHNNPHCFFVFVCCLSQENSWN